MTKNGRTELVVTPGRTASVFAFVLTGGVTAVPSAHFQLPSLKH